MTGFLAGDEARGRPVGLAMDGTGALLIADDAGNTVWRVAAADGSITAQPLSTDRVSASIANDGTSMRPLEDKSGNAATGEGFACPLRPISPPRFRRKSDSRWHKRQERSISKGRIGTRSTMSRPPS